MNQHIEDVVAGEKAIGKAFGDRSCRWVRNQVRRRTRFASVIRRDENNRLWALRSEIRKLIEGLPTVL